MTLTAGIWWETRTAQQTLSLWLTLIWLATDFLLLTLLIFFTIQGRHHQTISIRLQRFGRCNLYLRGSLASWSYISLHPGTHFLPSEEIDFFLENYLAHAGLEETKSLEEIKLEFEIHLTYVLLCKWGWLPFDFPSKLLFLSEFVYEWDSELVPNGVDEMGHLPPRTAPNIVWSSFPNQECFTFDRSIYSTLIFTLCWILSLTAYIISMV